MVRSIKLAGFAILLLKPLSSPAENLKPPPSASSERGTTTAFLKGGPLRWKNEWTMSPQILRGQPVVRFTEKGSGRYSPFDREVRWNIETIWSAGEWFRPLSSERTWESVKFFAGLELVMVTDPATTPVLTPYCPRAPT